MSIIKDTIVVHNAEARIAARKENELKRLVGVLDVKVSRDKGRTLIEFNRLQITSSIILNRITEWR